MLYLVEGREPRPWRDKVPLVRPALAGDVRSIALLSGYGAARVAAGLARTESTYLVAEREGKVLGSVELIHVGTLQYEGFWIESISIRRQERGVIAALLNGAIEEAKGRDSLDEVGLLVSVEATSLFEAAIGEGLKNEGAYRVFVRDLSR
jgi:N-acetylglutamate synthase-like GNAT family acetyltransferase